MRFSPVFAGLIATPLEGIVHALPSDRHKFTSVDAMEPPSVPSLEHHTMTMWKTVIPDWCLATPTFTAPLSKLMTTPSPIVAAPSESFKCSKHCLSVTSVSTGSGKTAQKTSLRGTATPTAPKSAATGSEPPNIPEKTSSPLIPNLATPAVKATSGPPSQQFSIWEMPPTPSLSSKSIYFSPSAAPALSSSTPSNLKNESSPPSFIETSSMLILSVPPISGTTPTTTGFPSSTMPTNVAPWSVHPQNNTWLSTAQPSSSLQKPGIWNTTTAFPSDSSSSVASHRPFITASTTANAGVSAKPTATAESGADRIVGSVLTVLGMTILALLF